MELSIDEKTKSLSVHPRTNHTQAQILRLEYPSGPVTEHYTPHYVEEHSTAILYRESILWTPQIKSIKTHPAVRYDDHLWACLILLLWFRTVE